jgi:hypothetical protein
MRTSEGIDQLIGALAKARGNFPEIPCTEQVSTNTYKYSYADLSDILAAVTPSLSGAELALLGGVENDVQGSVVVTVRLAHISGQWAESHLSIGTWAKMQELGAALTYARRYLTCVMLGIQPGGEDADGQTPERAAPRAQGKAEATPGQKNAEARAREQLLGAMTASLKTAALERGAMQQQLFDAFTTASWSKIKALPMADLQAGYAKLAFALQQLDTPEFEAPRAVEEIRSPALQDAPGDEITTEDIPVLGAPTEDAATGQPEGMDKNAIATDQQISGLRLSAQQIGGETPKELEEVLAHHKKAVPWNTYHTMRTYLDKRLATAKQGALV